MLSIASRLGPAAFFTSSSASSLGRSPPVCRSHSRHYRVPHWLCHLDHTFADSAPRRILPYRHRDQLLFPFVPFMIHSLFKSILLVSSTCIQIDKHKTFCWQWTWINEDTNANVGEQTKGHPLSVLISGDGIAVHGFILLSSCLRIFPPFCFACLIATAFWLFFYLRNIHDKWSQSKPKRNRFFCSASSATLSALIAFL